MQSRNFRLQRVGNLTWLEKNYQFRNIAFSLDELIVLNAQKENKSIEDFAKMLTNLVDDVFVPIAAGGGIRCLEDATLLFNSGADKIVLNSVLSEDPFLVKKLSARFGAQSIVASVDFKVLAGNKTEVYINDGRKALKTDLNNYLEYLETLPIGEIYLNSIDKDGTGFGYDFDIIEQVSSKVTFPLIIAGGAGNEAHLIEGLSKDGVSATATANLFNFIGNGLPIARKKIILSGENIADWNASE